MNLRTSLSIALLVLVTSCNGERDGARPAAGASDSARHRPPAALGDDTIPADTIMPRDTATLDTLGRRPD